MRPGAWLRALVHVLLVRPFTRWVIGFNVSGSESVRGLKQMVLAANHNSHLDGLLVFSSLPLRQAMRLHPVAAEDYFGQGDLWGMLARWLFNMVTISRTRVSRRHNPLERMQRVLDRGDSILIFPEGTRGEPDRMAPFQAGVGHLAKSFPDIPIVPVCVLGAGRSMPRGASVPVPVWTTVEFGSPLRAQGRPAETAAALEQAIREMAERAGRWHGAVPEAGDSRKPAYVAVVGIDGSGKSSIQRRVVEALSSIRPVAGIGDVLLLGRQGRLEDIGWIPGACLKQTLHRLAKASRIPLGYKLAKLAELAMRRHLQDVITLKFRPHAVVYDGHPLVNVAAWGTLAYPELFNERRCAEALGIMSGRGEPSLFYLRRMPEVLALRLFARFDLPDAMVLLKLDPGTAMRRIESRGEEKQMHETAEKLGRLQKAYEAVGRLLRERYGVRVLELDVDGKTLSEASQEAADFVRQVVECG
ncbi:MAG: 1-acyl-sn-glycerol-3-phosphate acyltransferase [Elusimicrobiota bacterium]